MGSAFALLSEATARRRVKKPSPGGSRELAIEQSADDLEIVLGMSSLRVELIEVSYDQAYVYFLIGEVWSRTRRLEFVRWFKNIYEDDGFGSLFSEDRKALHAAKEESGWLVGDEERSATCSVTGLTYEQRLEALRRGRYFLADQSVDLQRCHFDMPIEVRNSPIEARIEWYFDPANYRLACRGANALDSRKGTIRASFSSQAVAMLGCGALWPVGG